MKMSQKNNACCYECPDREIGCHSKCEKYKKFRKELDKKKKSIKDQNARFAVNRPYRERYRKKYEQ